MSSLNILTRLRASAVHLLASVAMALILVLLVTKVWYPSHLFELASGRDIFLILICCDITLGPVMTLIIFNTLKPRKELVRDIAVIATLQLAAMFYGVSTLLTARPAYIVYNAGQFNVPLANELVNSAKRDEQNGDIPSAPWAGPELVGSKMPSDAQEKNDLTFSSIDGRGDIFQMPRYFVNYDAVRQDVLANALTINAFSQRMHLDSAVLESATETYRRRSISIGLLPLVVRSRTALAVIDMKNGDFLGLEPIAK